MRQKHKVCEKNYSLRMKTCISQEGIGKQVAVLLTLNYGTNFAVMGLRFWSGLWQEMRGREEQRKISQNLPLTCFSHLARRSSKLRDIKRVNLVIIRIFVHCRWFTCALRPQTSKVPLKNSLKLNENKFRSLHISMGLAASLGRGK